MDLSIIIVNYNVKYFLEQCLYSIRRASRDIQAEVIVVDNASSDGSIAYLVERFPAVTFIDNAGNFGFSKANNQGLQEASGRYILFLNPDTILAEDSLVNCIRFLDADEEAGACGVRMLDGSGKFLPESKRAFPGIKTSFYKLSGLTSLFPKSPRFGRYHLGHLSEFSNAEVDILSGAFLMVKKKVIDQTGGFDEAFFMYGEDIDLSYRIQKKGFKNFYFSDTTIIHFKGESTKKGTFNYVKLFYSAMEIFVKKHYSKNRSMQLAMLIQLSTWLKGGVSVMKNMISPQQTKTSPNLLQAVIVGSQDVCSKVEIILKKQPIRRAIRHIENLEAWVNHSSFNKTDEVFFCTGDISYKEIIRQVSKLRGGFHFYLHAAGSNSIVGSNSSNTSGLVMGV